MHGDDRGVMAVTDYYKKEKHSATLIIEIADIRYRIQACVLSTYRDMHRQGAFASISTIYQLEHDIIHTAICRLYQDLTDIKVHYQNSAMWKSRIAREAVMEMYLLLSRVFEKKRLGLMWCLDPHIQVITTDRNIVITIRE